MAFRSHVLELGSVDNCGLTADVSRHRLMFPENGTDGSVLMQMMTPAECDAAMFIADGELTRLTGKRPQRSLSIVSRVSWRNVLLWAVDSESEFSIKVFLRRPFAARRFAVESIFGSELCQIPGLQIPPVLRRSSDPTPGVAGVIVRPWIKGESLIARMQRNPVSAVENDLPVIIEQLESLWRFNVPIEVRSSIPMPGVQDWDGRGRGQVNFGLTRTNLFRKIFNERESLRSKLRLIERGFLHWEPFSSSHTLTHGDPSGHEWLCAENGYCWIDWETAMFHDPVADLAGLYHSLAHFFADHAPFDDALWKAITSRVSYEKMLSFGLYFVERAFTASLITDHPPSDSELVWALGRYDACARSLK